MKKTLLIIALSISLGNLNAQSDATLEQTKEWLEIDGSKLIQDPEDYYSNAQIRFNGYEFIFYRYLHVFDRKSELTISDFRTVNKVELLPVVFNYRIIVYGGKGYTNLDQDEELNMKRYFDFTNENNAIKVFKALEHLYSFYNDCNPKFENKVKP